MGTPSRWRRCESQGWPASSCVYWKSKANEYRQRQRTRPSISGVKRIENGEEVDLDKAWHGLHFLFTGTDEEGTEPACFLLCGGEEIGDEDVGPARVLRPDQVSQFAAFLAELSRDELARRYDPERMTALDIYHSVIWKRPAAPGETGFDYLFDAFEDLRDFVTATSASGESMIVSIT